MTGNSRNGGYQHYTVCLQSLVSPIPDSMPTANAAVLPLSITTATSGLYEHLKLDLPTLSATPHGKTVFIWGGSSSVGSTAIQLAVGSGYTVATTASAHNHEYVRGLRGHGRV